MKKVIATLLSLAMVFGFTFAPGINNKVEAKQKKYTGEEIFRGFVFAQGELGHSLPEVFNQSMVEKLNTKKTEKFAKSIIEKIKKENPSFFDELQEATYSNNPAQIDSLLKEAGGIIENDVAAMEKAVKTGVVAQEASVSVEWYYYYYYAAAAAAGIVLVLFAIDITPVIIKDDTNREMAIRSLVEEVN
ncbi:sporulation delaying protein family toxin [Radiobacillus kanasensis]|uniref:sporulation delaying protein family toxin n=1 Tax=Radiobacillus kanasensis TaxID=2844358 RepID=UPI001E33F4E2|nr:sporulation delaying protein family toxin [Radiobacillus kanasensis]UFT99136.1 sporulation delaying protein family toxin [Radiobacillus kanasensis]